MLQNFLFLILNSYLFKAFRNTNQILIKYIYENHFIFDIIIFSYFNYTLFSKYKFNGSF